MSARYFALSAQRLGRGLAVATSLLLLAACDPPGKPPLEDTESIESSKIADFRTLYENNCAGCHGVDGKNGPARILNSALYLSYMPKEELHAVLVYGRPGTAMPAWAIRQGGPLTDKQIDILVDGIYSNWSKPSQFANTKLPPYTVDLSAADATNGKKLYLRDCFACHAKGGLVGPVNEPNYLALSSNQMIRTSIVVGREDFGMPNYKVLNLGHELSSENVNDLVAYLDSLRPVSAKNVGEMPPSAGQQAGPTGVTHVNESGAGEGKATTKGNEGSGNGPGSVRHQEQEGNKGKGSSSQQGVK